MAPSLHSAPWPAQLESTLQGSEQPVTALAPCGPPLIALLGPLLTSACTSTTSSLATQSLGLPHDRPGTSTLIGVAISILANTLVCLSLNLQRLAHIRRARKGDSTRSAPFASSRGRSPTRTAHERTPLIVTTKPTLDRSLSDPEPGPENPLVLVPSLSRTDSRILGGSLAQSGSHGANEPASASASTKVQSPPPLSRARSSSRRSSSHAGGHPRRPRTDKGFLKSKLWLAGFACLNVGEFLNFLGYGYAPPSVIAPLGMVALVANVFLAPLIVREPFRRKDLVGVAIAIVGGATVVYASRSSDQKPTPEEFLAAISRPLFIAYAVISCASMAVLAYLSRTKLGDQYVLVDLALCALAGAFTVLSTKAISSFLNLLFLRMFSYWITYPVLLVLVVTALLQINYVNKSLQRFESRVVIPTQFMSFALSTIVGSAILYRDFEGVPAASLLNFVLGCLISGLGVYLLTQDPPSQPQPPPHASSTSSSARRPAAALSSSSSSADTPPLLSRHSHPHSHTLGLGLGASPSSPSSHPHPAARLLPVPLRAAAPAGAARARTLSVTLGGGFLLAGSPSSVPLVGVPGGRGREDEDEDEEAVRAGEEDGEDDEARVGSM
ncbi:magnesium transporter NIPA-domain-containing protein [Rhodotorula diobovata]|uniref:Magnesium transporter NIPA-domain-containing protein n=1 Tax=Rhodotorula diobovata TaxID=5288 RepID=A0A5C5FRJ8_9BASI|nr:magnesium transporter NIPA-domain-containing protein [Rhodotorula diobovata]